MQLTGHINEDQVMALYLGNLSSEDEQRLHHHVSDCSACSRELALYREMLSGVETLVQEMGGAEHAPLLRTAIQKQLRRRQIYYDLLYHALVGPVWVAMSLQGVCMIHFSDRTPFEIEEELRELRPEAWIVRDRQATAKLVAELREYLQRRRDHFMIPIDWRFITPGFQRQVLEFVGRIPYGQVYTYGEVAEFLRQPKAARAVGQALGNNPIPMVIPCHRVVAAGGKLGGFSAGTNIKRRLLELEGVRWPNFSRQMDLFAQLR